MWIYKILIYGGVILKKAMIYVHGKGGSYLEAEQFKNICLDFDVFGVDYNDYFPWIVKNKIMEVYDKISEKYDYIYVLANSIGAYFTMHTLQNFKIEKALFISPILDMEQLIVDMMSWANVSEKELSERKEIPTDFGETLSWEYLCFVRANPINWKTPTEILYAEHDNLTSRQTVDKFIDRHCAKELKDLDNHAYQAGSETSSNVVDALDSVDELETDLDQSKESMYKLSYVIRVSAPDLDELKRRCDEVKDFYDDLNVKLVRPAGDMLGLHSEFLPASKRYINDYVQYVKSDFLAGLGFGATQQLGETTGIYMGYSVDTGRNVYLQPSLASQGVKGTVTNALASAFVGSLGGGKSFCNNLLVYYAVLFGGQAILLDPKSERGNWKETLPEIAHEINIVNLTSDKDNAGLLDPFVIMKNVKDAESLAIDILTFLTGISSRDGEKFPVLRKAVRSVTQSDSRGLLHVIDELRREDTPVSRNIADHIDSFTDYDFAHLLFSDGTVENAISLDNQLNIIQVADLVLPDKDTTFEEYTTIELLSVSMLIVISTFALDFIHSDRSIFKIVDLDEAWAFLNVAQGETLSNKLVRAGRAMQAGVYFVTQSSGDVAKESLKNNIGLKFAFRSTDINEIKQTLEFFGIDKDDENNQKRLRDLENGQCLLQDLYGRVGVVQIHPVFEELLHAFDTRPPVQRNEVE